MEQLKPYHAHKEEMIKINKGKRFQQAVDAVEEFLKKGKGKDQVRNSRESFRGPFSTPHCQARLAGCVSVLWTSG